METTQMTVQGYIPTTELSHEEWLKMRRSGIGGSDAAAVLGVHQYKTALDVFYDKTGNIEPIAENERMHFGKKLEDVIAEEFAERNGRRVINDNKIRTHKIYPFIIGNIDRVILSNEEEGTGLLEIKTTNSFARKGWTDTVPYEWYCQVMHYLSITGYEYAFIAVLIDGNHYEQIRLSRDDEFIALLEDRISVFWREHVEKGIPPEASTPEDVGKYFNKVNPDTVLEATEETAALVAELKGLKARIKELESTEDELSGKLKLILREHESLLREGKLLATFKSVTSTRIDTKLVKAHVADWNKYAVSQTTRSLLLK